MHRKEGKACNFLKEKFYGFESHSTVSGYDKENESNGNILQNKLQQDMFETT